MSATSTLILLPQTVYNGNGNNSPYTVTGNQVQAAAYYQSPRNLQTVNYRVVNFTGNLLIEASLAGTPGSTDWFRVHKLEANSTANSNSEAYNNSNVNVAVNIVGNFVWLRAKIENFNAGAVQYTKVSY